MKNFIYLTQEKYIFFARIIKKKYLNYIKNYLNNKNQIQIKSNQICLIKGMIFFYYKIKFIFLKVKSLMLTKKNSLPAFQTKYKICLKNTVKKIIEICNLRTKYDKKYKTYIINY